MNKNDVVIEVKNIKKDFYLPHDKDDSLKRKITQLFKNKERGVDIHHALKGISFDIKKGEFFGIVGRNGSGKSTLLKILAEIYQPTKGSIKVKGKLVPFIELGVGFNPQLTGRENVYLNGALLGFSKKEIDDRYNKIVEFAELEDFMDQQLKNYSSGMKVRLAFSVAIQSEADILLLDEVLAVGDADFQRKCYNYFKSLKAQKKTIVFVTHSMGAVREYCDRAILIEDGKLMHSGSADEVADEYLKLFNKSNKNDSDATNRWGNQDILVEKGFVEVNNKIIKFTFNIKSNIDMENVVFGFRVKDNEGIVIAGASTVNVMSGRQKMKFYKGEKKTIIFETANIFGNASYSVSTTIKLSDGTTIFDSYNDLLEFSTSQHEVYYPVVCPAKLTIL